MIWAPIARGVLGMVSTGLNMLGTHMDVMSDVHQLGYQADLMRNNAARARFQARDAIARGETSADDLRRAAEDVRSQGRTGFAAGNVAVGSESVLDWERSLDMTTDESVARTLENARRTAWGFNQEARDYDIQAGMYDWAKDQRRRFGKLEVWSSLLDGVGNLVGGGF